MPTDKTLVKNVGGMVGSKIIPDQIGNFKAPLQ